MPLPSPDRLLLFSRHPDSVSAERRIVGLIAIDESFARRLEISGRDVPWESLIHLWPGEDAEPCCNQVLADVDRLANDLVAEFAALTGPGQQNI